MQGVTYFCNFFNANIIIHLEFYNGRCCFPTPAAIAQKILLQGNRERWGLLDRMAFASLRVIRHLRASCFIYAGVPPAPAAGGVKSTLVSGCGLHPCLSQWAWQLPGVLETCLTGQSWCPYIHNLSSEMFNEFVSTVFLAYFQKRPLCKWLFYTGFKQKGCISQTSKRIHFLGQIRYWLIRCGNWRKDVSWNLSCSAKEWHTCFNLLLFIKFPK